MDPNELLTRVAWLYYIEGLTQQEIGERLNLQRVKVNRLLKEARNQGVVEFRIAKTTTHMELERDLRQAFDLRGVYVTPTPLEPERLRTVLGEAAANYLSTLLRPNMLVGLGMGRTLAEIPSYLEPQAEVVCDFVEMVGGAGRSDLGFDTYNVSYRLAEHYGGSADHVFCPVVVESAESRAALLQDPQIASVLERAARCDLALLGIGGVADDMLMYQLGCCDYETVESLRRRGAVGDILGHFIDVDGVEIPYPLSERLIGLHLQQMAEIPITLAVAGGPSKVDAMLGALRGRYINALVTDTVTAQAVLERHRLSQPVSIL